MTKLIKKYQIGRSIKNDKVPFSGDYFTHPSKKQSIKNYPVLKVNDPFSGDYFIGKRPEYIRTLNIEGFGPNLKQENLNNFYNILNARKDLNKYQKSVIAANVAHESYYNPIQKQIGGPAYGILQYEGDRQNEYKQFINNSKYKNKPMEAAIDYLYDTMIKNPDTQKHWNKGRKYTSATEAYNSFKNAKDLRTAMDSSFYGYVRPKDDSSYEKRYKLAEQFLEAFN